MSGITVSIEEVGLQVGIEEAPVQVQVQASLDAMFLRGYPIATAAPIAGQVPQFNAVTGEIEWVDPDSLVTGGFVNVGGDTMTGQLVISAGGLDVTGGIVGDTINVSGVLQARGADSHAIGTTSDDRYVLLVGGTITQTSGISTALQRVTGNINPTVGSSAYGLTVAALNFQTAASGNHANFSSLDCSPPIILAGSGTVDLSTALYVSGQGTGATLNYAMMVGSGVSRFDGIIQGPNTLDRLDLQSSGSGGVHLRGDSDITFRIDSGGAGSGTLFTWERASALELMTLADTGLLTLAGVFSVSGDIISAGGGVIRSDSSDGADDDVISITGGGGNSVTRGAQVQLFGNEHASFPGDLALNAGTTGDVLITTGGAARITVTDAATTLSNALALTGIPTSDPGGSGLVWSDGGTLKIT